MIDPTELKEQLQNLIKDLITFNEFNIWLNDKQWNLSFDSPRENKEFFWAVENCVCDFLFSKINYEELIARFQFIVELDNTDTEMLR